MELRSGKRMQRQTFVIDEPPFEPAGPSAIESILPDDVLMSVFQCLERQGDWEALSLVSKSWRRLAAVACTKLRLTRRAGGQRMAQVLHRFGPGLQSLDLGSAPFLRDSDMRTLSYLCPSLTSITLSWQDSFSDQGLRALARACGARLLELSLARCQGISFRGIAAACNFLPGLRLLDISHVLGKARVAVIHPTALAAFYEPHILSGTKASEQGMDGCWEYDSVRPCKVEQLPLGDETLIAQRIAAELWGNDFRNDDGVNGFEGGVNWGGLQGGGVNAEEGGVNGAGLQEGGVNRGGLREGGVNGGSLQEGGVNGVGNKEGELGDVDSTVTSIARSCKNLQTLLLKDCSALCDFSDRGLEGLASGNCADSLTTLDLSFCEKVTDQGLLTLSEKCSKLRELSLACLSSARNVTSAGLVHVLKNCLDLTSLDLSGNTLGQEWFHQLGVHSKSLVRLNLNRCRAEPDQPYFPVWKLSWGSCKFTLTHLNLMECAGLENLNLSMIAVSCVALKVLRISGCEEVTDRGLEELGRFRGAQLEELVLRGASIGDTGKNSFKSGAPWPKLHSLSVSQCEWLEDEALQSIALHCEALTFLEAGDCFDVGGIGFALVIDSCKKLEKLMLYQNPGIRTITGGAPRPNLLELDISGCSLRASNLRTLAARCPNLENVDISGNKHLDGEGLQALVNGCSRLAVLDIQDCPKVTDKAIVLALQTSNSLRKVFVTRKNLGQRLESLGKKRGCKIMCC